MSGARVVLLGGTKGIGRAMARILSQRGDRVLLLGRDVDDLERSAADLAVRSGAADDGASSGCFGKKKKKKG